MDQHKSALERAFELAKSGQFSTFSDLKRAVTREGYLQAQLEGPSLARQLSALIKANRPTDAE